MISGELIYSVPTPALAGGVSAGNNDKAIAAVSRYAKARLRRPAKLREDPLCLILFVFIVKSPVQIGL
jgi:hypothetical protein